MNAESIRIMTDEQLKGAELNARQGLFEARMGRATGELADTMKVRHLKRDLARILTIQAERTRGSHQAPDPNEAVVTEA